MSYRKATKVGVVNLLKSEVMKLPIEEGKCLIDTMTQYVKDHLEVSSRFVSLPYVITDIKWLKDEWQYTYKAEVTIEYSRAYAPDPPPIFMVVKSVRNRYTRNQEKRHTRLITVLD